MKTLKCPECGKSKIRAQTAETCRVEINSDTGDIDVCDDFLNDGVDENSLYCEFCGQNLDLRHNGKNYELIKRL